MNLRHRMWQMFAMHASDIRERRQAKKKSDFKWMLNQNGEVVRHFENCMGIGLKPWYWRRLNILERLEMKNLRWMMGIKRIEKIRTEEIRARAVVTNVSETIEEARLRRLGRVERKTEEDLETKIWKMKMIGHRKMEDQKVRRRYYVIQKYTRQ